MNDRPIDLAPGSRHATRWTITIVVALATGIVVYRALDADDEELKLPNPGPLHPAAVPPTLPPPPPLSSVEATRSMRVTGTLDGASVRHRLEWARGQRVRVVVEDSDVEVRLELVAPSRASFAYDQRDLEVPETGVWTVLVHSATGEPGEYALRLDLLTEL